MWQLSPLDIGEDNPKLEPQQIKTHQYGQTKEFLGVSRHVETNSDLSFGL